MVFASRCLCPTDSNPQHFYQPGLVTLRNERPLTDATGKILLTEFAYGGKVMPSGFIRTTSTAAAYSESLTRRGIL